MVLANSKSVKKSSYTFGKPTRFPILTCRTRQRSYLCVQNYLCIIINTNLISELQNLNSCTRNQCIIHNTNILEFYYYPLTIATPNLVLLRLLTLVLFVSEWARLTCFSGDFSSVGIWNRDLTDWSSIPYPQS